MLHSQTLSDTSAINWDHPALKPFIERENAVEGECIGDDDELERELVHIWQQAKVQYPDLPISYLRLAGVLQDFDRAEEAANVLREGIARGHNCLFGDLVSDFPAQLSESELRDSLSDPTLTEKALAAILNQGRAELAVGAIEHVLHHATEGSPNLDRLVNLLARLVVVLIESGKDEQAGKVQMALAVHLDSKDKSASLVSVLGEIIDAQSWADEASRGSLARFELSGAYGDLWSSLTHLSGPERRTFCSALRRNCQHFAAEHDQALRHLEKQLARDRMMNWMLTAAALSALLGAVWYWAQIRNQLL